MRANVFFRENRTKDTPLAKLPQDWAVARLSSVARLIMGQSPPSSTYNREGVGLPFLQGKMEFGEIYPSPETYCSDPLRVAEPNDVLISVRAPVGDVNLAPDKLCIGRGLAAIRFDRNIANHLFYFYFLQRIKSSIERLGKGSTFKAIVKDDLENLNVAFPPLREQQKIAEIFSTVDEAIQKTSEIIATTERLKKGLIQKLLTGGIGHKEFKETEIGRIPEEWKVTRLDEVAKVRSGRPKFGSDVKETAFIPMELVPEEGIHVSFQMKSLDSISSSTYCEAGDILLAKITPSLENGKQGIVPKTIPGRFALATTEVFPIICENVERMFLFYLLKFMKFRKILEGSMRATTGRLRVPREALLNLRIPVPKVEEQQRIASTLSTVDQKLEVERNEKSELEIIKRGLMDLLLSGKIRIKVN